MIKTIGDFLLFLTAPIILGASLILTFKTRFIQVRKIPEMFRLLFTSGKKEGPTTVKAHKALFTAMATTIGISTIVSPVIAIRLGGPGAVLGFILATFLGAAVNFTEVTFALSYRKHHPKKGVTGGPMQYLQDEIGPLMAKWYAFFGVILLMAWSAAQANQLAQVMTRVPTWITGVLLAMLILVILIGGIKRVASFSAKLVPAMFIIYVFAALWIIFINLEKLPAIFELVLSAAFAPRSFASGVAVGGLMSALRWGLFKGLHATEAGVGTQTIPHSMAETSDPVNQGILAMISTYSAGFICILSSLVTLITETWLSSDLSLGINMVAASFQYYFSTMGLIIVVVSAFLFAFGTILGNCFNGSQCFLYLTKHRFLKGYYLATALLIFVGCIMDVALIWSLVDYLIIPVVIPHILSIVYLSYKQGDLLQEESAAVVS